MGNRTDKGNGSQLSAGQRSWAETVSGADGAGAAGGRERAVSRAAATSPAAANRLAMSISAWWNVVIGPLTASLDKIATSPATPITVPICLAMLSIPLPVPNLAAGSAALPAPSSEGMVSPTPGAAKQLGGQQVRHVRGGGLELGVPEQDRAGVDQATDHRHPASPADLGREPRRDQAGERQHHQRTWADGQTSPDGRVVPDAGEELHRIQHERAESGVVKNRGHERAAEVRGTAIARVR